MKMLLTKLSLASAAIVAAILLCASTNLISGWGFWYGGGSTPYRRETDRLFQGKMALSSSPTDIGHDLAWGPNGVEQVWGMGVPFWRMPFEAWARIWHEPGFPDRLAIAAAWALMIYLVSLAFLSPAEPGRTWFQHLARHPERLAAIAVLGGFAPILTMCRGPFNIYEEPILYGYFFGVMAFAGLIAFFRRPNFSAYVALCLLSGLAGLFRPTFACYGFASVVLACFLTWRAKWPWWQSLAGLCCFGFGGALLFACNLHRFGSGFEFGHNINLTNDDLVFTARFGAPFDHEHFWPAFKELIGSLFWVQYTGDGDFYGTNLVAWQSPTVRWRQFYETTFDFAVLAGVLICWGRAAVRFVRVGFRRSSGQAEPGSQGVAARPAAFPLFRGSFDVWDTELLLTAAWSIISLVPVSLFYLHFHAVACRYYFDFAPGLAVGMAGCFVLKSRNNLAGYAVKFVLLGLTAGWWIWDVNTSRGIPGGRGVNQLNAISRAQFFDNGFHPTLPSRYTTGNPPESMTGIPGNGTGWTAGSGRAYYAISLFFDSPQKLTIEVAPVARRTVTDDDYAQIKAKVGFETLKLESMKDGPNGKILTFAGPTREAYRHGIQLVSLGFVRPEAFNLRSCPFNLLLASVEDNPKL